MCVQVYIREEFSVTLGDFYHIAGKFGKFTFLRVWQKIVWQMNIPANRLLMNEHNYNY